MKRVIFVIAILLLMDLNASSSYSRAVKQYQSRDYNDALKSFYVSARHHNLNAYYMLGKMHEEGIGTAVNYQTAFYWYEKSAMRGHPSAQYRLARMFEKGKGVVAKMDKAKVWYKKAATNGNKDAKARLEHWDNKIARKSSKHIDLETKIHTDEPKKSYRDSNLETILPSAVSKKETQIKSTKDVVEPTSKEDEGSSMVDMLKFWK